MADETQHQVLPPIANSLRNMHCFLDRVLASTASTIPTAPLRQQAAHMNAVIGNVAEAERQLAAAEAELARLRPHQDFLAVCKELYMNRWTFEQPTPAAMLASILGKGEIASDREITRGDFIGIAAMALSAALALDAQPAAPEMEEAHG